MNWSNQAIVLYHGTTIVHADAIVASGVDVTIGQIDLDFGSGFYCTTLRKQAVRWSKWKAMRLGGTPAVLRFIVPRDEIAGLDVLSFVTGGEESRDFWRLVSFCRNGGTPHARQGHASSYDIVFGPVALWKSQQPMPNSDQVSFHTRAAQNLLNKAAPEHRINMTIQKAGAFWRTVIDCLTEFYQFDRDEATRRVNSLIATMTENGDFHPTRDLIYHSEPIHIASDLAGQRASQIAEVPRTPEFYRRYRQLESDNLKLVKNKVAQEKTPASIELRYFIDAA